MKSDNLTVKHYDYHLIDPKTKSKLIYLAGEINKAARNHVEFALEMGKFITEAHKVLAGDGCEGQFKPWIEMETCLSRSTAYEYMRAYEIFGDTSDGGHFSAKGMYLLSAAKSPEAAAVEAKKLASKGVRITIERARELVKRYGKKSPPSDSVTSTSDTPSDTHAVPADACVPEPPPAEPEDEDEATAFDPETIEQAPSPPVAPKQRSGHPVVSRQLRTKTQKAMGEVIRLLERCGIYDQHAVPLSAILDQLERI